MYSLSGFAENTRLAASDAENSGRACGRQRYRALSGFGHSLLSRTSLPRPLAPREPAAHLYERFSGLLRLFGGSAAIRVRKIDAAASEYRHLRPLLAVHRLGPARVLGEPPASGRSESFCGAGAYRNADERIRRPARSAGRLCNFTGTPRSSQSAGGHAPLCCAQPDLVLHRCNSAIYEEGNLQLLSVLTEPRRLRSGLPFSRLYNERSRISFNSSFVRPIGLPFMPLARAAPAHNSAACESRTPYLRSPGISSRRHNSLSQR